MSHTNGMSLHIRRATEEDWPRIWPIMKAVVASGDSYMLASDCPEEEAHEYWMGIPIQTYLAEENGDVVGTYALRVNQRGRGAHVANAGYMVRPGLFGKGTGAALCEHSLNAARAQGFLAMQFNAVVSTNARAVALWQRLGFAIVGTVPQAYLHATLGYVDIYIMHREL